MARRMAKSGGHRDNMVRERRVGLGEARQAFIWRLTPSPD